MAMMPPGPGGAPLPPGPAADPVMGGGGGAPMITPDMVLPFVLPGVQSLKAQQEGFLAELVAQFEQATAMALAEALRMETNPMAGPVAGMAGAPADPLAAPLPPEEEVV